MKRVFFLLLFIFPILLEGQNLVTPFEKSGQKETGTYHDVIEFYQALDQRYEEVKMVAVGMTDSGYPLHLVMLDYDQRFNAEEARKSGKTVLLINNGIHPGEPDGIEASMMFLRNTVKDQRAEFQNIFLGIIPIYNVGGSLNRNSHTRANQNGPLEYGFRGNAQNRDLNRDFIKMDTKNALAFAEIFHMMNPDVFIDTHVSNGADYQYTITHLATQPDKLGGELGDYMQNQMIPQLEKGMKSRKAEIIPYVNSFGTTPDQGYGIFFDSPRYSTGYTTLFNTLGFMIETHMLKPFDQRVNSTYQFFETVVGIIKKDGEVIQNMRNNSAKHFSEKDSYTITWSRNRQESREIIFKGYEPSRLESPFGGQRLYYDREKPIEKKIPYYDRFDADLTVKVPDHYIIPQGWHKVIDRLKLNKIEMLILDQDSSIAVESYRIEDVQYSRGPYEGHFMHRGLSVSKSQKIVTFRKGDVIIPTQQRGIRYIIETLEPESTDSFFKWNFFDAILQQKEYFSSYVFEDVAISMLENDAKLKSRFDTKKAEDTEFAQNRRSQLDWIYRNSAYYEPAHRTYPVYRTIN